MLAFLIAFLLQERVETDAGCIKCHENQVDDWKGSVHAAKAVGCVKCHRAESVDTTKSKPHLFAQGFVRGTKKGSGPLCTQCHRKEGVDWAASAHAEDTKDEGGRSRGCSSCHAFHETVVARPAEILKESCLRCHKPGTEAIRFGEQVVDLAGRFSDSDRILYRIEQHRASAERLRRLVDAYNKSDPGPGRPPWLWIVPAVPFLAAVILWIRPGPGRRAS